MGVHFHLRMCMCVTVWEQIFVYSLWEKTGLRIEDGGEGRVTNVYIFVCLLQGEKQRIRF